MAVGWCPVQPETHQYAIQVVPIFKKGSRSDPGNYRPISLTSLLCKTLEHNYVMGHLEQNNILSDIQFPPKAFCRSSAISY